MRELTRLLNTEPSSRRNSTSTRKTSMLGNWLARRLLKNFRPRVHVRNVHVRYEDMDGGRLGARASLRPAESEPFALGIVLGELAVDSIGDASTTLVNSLSIAVNSFGVWYGRGGWVHTPPPMRSPLKHKGFGWINF
mmetsp:Transcript_13532/g.40071  ORF Transcript_13532/g.40071 Transcript_13532/m.40071 type:complete len:137 (-) Transcript_13532:337-747(-)